MGKFNFGRKHISLLISGVAISGVVISSTVYAGYSKWVFKDTATESHGDAHYEVDTIRENATFYDGYDAVDEGTKYYDVYFMAQSIKVDQMLTCNSDGKTCSFKEEFLKSPYYYIDTNSDDYIDSADFGHFSGADCDTTNYSFDIDKNYWFTRLENISEISVSAYDDVVSRIENNLVDRNNFRLEFLCWSLDPLAIYGTKGTEWPKDFSHVGTAAKVDGFYPYSKGFTPFYMNTSLDLYDKNVKTINGRKTLFLYPVFSTGKNYFDFWTEDENRRDDEIKDFITVTKRYSDGTDDKNYYPYFNGTVTQQLEKEFRNSNFDVYSLDNLVITQKELTTSGLNTITIKNDINRESTSEGWAGEGDFVHTVKDEEGNSLNLLNMSSVQNLKSGRYNIYIFVKHLKSSGIHDERAITTGEVSSINSVMEKNNRIRYSSIAGQAYSVTHGFLGFYCDYRDYYVYFERIYEPRIIGGPTLDLNYDSELSNSLQFLRQGSSGNDNNRYQRRGVELQGDNWIEYPLSGGRTLLFKDYYFGVMLNPEVSFTSYGFNLKKEEDLTTDTDYAAAGFPSVTYEDQNGVLKTEYYKSDSIFETYNPDAYDDDNADVKIRNDLTGVETKYTGTGTQSFVLIKPKNIDTTGKGIYNIVIDIKYDENTGGSDPNLIVPKLVTFYGYKLSNLFVNILETDENGEVEMGHTQGGTHYEHFVNTDVYEYTRSKYYELANVTLDDVFTAKDDSTKTLRDILTELKADGKCLEDLVTSRYITLENLDPDNENYIPFTIQKNYVFKIVSIPAELQ